MTTLICWYGRDSRGAASMYVAADSRITWRDNKGAILATWDRARKVFASQRYPDVFGYCGDAFFPTQLLGQAIELLDRDLLFDVHGSSIHKVGALKRFLEESLSTYSDRARLGFDLVYASREGDGMKCGFRLHRLSYSGDRWDEEGPVQLPGHSALLFNLGSGNASVAANFVKWEKSSTGGTSRGVFSAFCDSLRSSADPSSGGFPPTGGNLSRRAGKSFRDH